MVRLLFIFTVLFSSTVFADNREELVSDFIEASGINELIDSMPAQFEQQHIQRTPTAKDPEMEAKVLEIFLQSIDPDSAKQTVHDYITENMGDSNLQAISKWLGSTLGSRLTSAENRQSDPGFQADFLNYVAYIQSNPPLEDRVAVIQEFESAARLTDLTIEYLRLLMEGMLVSFSKLSDDESYTAIDLNEALDSMEVMLRELLWQQNLLLAHFTYQDFSNEEIETYSEFLSSDVGRAYLEVTIGAFTAVFHDLFDKVMPQFEALAEEQSALKEAA